MADNETMFSIDLETGTQEWTQNGRHHNDDGPALVTRTGYKSWYSHGIRHRTGGPAVIMDDMNLWYINGEIFDDVRKYQIAAKMSDEEILAMVIKYGDL